MVMLQLQDKCFCEEGRRNLVKNRNEEDNGVSYAACGCWLHHFLEMQLCRRCSVPVTSKLVLILSTLEGWQAESTQLVLFQWVKGAQTKDPKILSQPPSPLSQHQAFEDNNTIPLFTSCSYYSIYFSLKDNEGKTHCHGWLEMLTFGLR